MRKTLRTEYYHLTGMPTSKEKDGANGKPNYIRASLCYDSRKGYYADIRTVYKYMLEDVELVLARYGFDNNTMPSLSEVLIPCKRHTKNYEKKAVDIYENTVISAITDRLKYRIDIEDVVA